MLVHCGIGGGKKPHQKLKEKNIGGWAGEGEGGVFVAEFFVHVCWFVVELVGKKNPPKIKREKHCGLGWVGGRGKGSCDRIFLCMCVGSLWNCW